MSNASSHRHCLCNTWVASLLKLYQVCLKDTRQLVGILVSSVYVVEAENLKTRVSPNIERRQAMADTYRDPQRMSPVLKEGDPRPPSTVVLLHLATPNLSHVYVGGRDGPLLFCREHFGRYRPTCTVYNILNSSKKLRS